MYEFEASYNRVLNSAANYRVIREFSVYNVRYANPLVTK